MVSKEHLKAHCIDAIRKKYGEWWWQEHLTTTFFVVEEVIDYLAGAHFLETESKEKSVKPIAVP